MTHIRAAVLALLSLLAVAPAGGQVPNFPQTLPGNTVVGRIGPTAGPTQSISIQQLGSFFAASTSVTGSGAKCDGATDDTAAINAALARGGWWTIPAGKTCAVTQLNITVSGTRLSGAHFNTSILKGTTNNATTINVSASLSNIYLDNIQLTKSGTATSGGNGITFAGDCQYCVLDSVFVQKSYVGIAAKSAGVSYMRHVLSQQNLNDGISFTNSAASDTIQWDLDDVFSGQNVGRGFTVASGSGSGGITLGNWHNVRTFANTGVGAGFIGTASKPINGVRITKGFFGQDGNHEIFLDTYGGLHTISGGTYAELAGTSATGPTLSTAASNTGDGIRITANNTDVSISAALINGNHDSGVNTSATTVTSVTGSRISNHGLYGITAANCALLNGAGDSFASNTSANVNCTTNSGSQIISGSLPSAVNAGVPLSSITGIAANCPTWLATSSSANLASCMTDETGTAGSIVFSNGPTLTNPIVGTQSVSDSSTKAASTAYVDRVAKKVISVNTSFFVTTTGNDSNGCTNNSSDACLTIQRAYDNLVDNYRIQGKTTVATISVGNGTYTAGLLTARCVDGQNGTAAVQIIGNATPSNVIISTTSNDAFGLGELAFGAGTQGCTQISIGGMRLQTTTSGNGVNVSGGGVGITVGVSGFPIDFGTTVQDHLVANHGAWIIAGTNNTISGGALIHAAAVSNSVIAEHNTTITCSGSPAFTYFNYAETNGTVFSENITFTSCGTATGTRYIAQNGGVIYSLSASATYLPGNASGVVQSKGNYVNNAVSKWDLTADVTGTLPVANGGTGVTTGTAFLQTAPVTVDFSVAGDNTLTVPLPSGFTRITATAIMINGASADISAANFGLFTATGGGGTAMIAAATAITVTSASDNTANNAQLINTANTTNGTYTPVSNQIYFRVGTTAAAGRTAKVSLRYNPAP